MKYRLMDLLACPKCKNFPLKLTIYEIKEYPNREFKISKCELYCSYLDKWINKEKIDTPCNECIKKEIVGGLLQCEKCGEWYPIYDEIPMMLFGELRDKKLEAMFISKYKDKLPKEILEQLKQ